MPAPIAANPHATPCPCGGGRPYADCCAPWHTGTQQGLAPDAERLMRSRYTAYVLGLMHYVQDTWHASTRPQHLDPLEPGLQWLGLEVRRHTPMGPDAATVEFVARSKWGGRAHRLHETSRFVREGGRWFYVDGDVR